MVDIQFYVVRYRNRVRLLFHFAIYNHIII
nr:MAG TPA: hypothetical protein [Caudoviricetes sp.]